MEEKVFFTNSEGYKLCGLLVNPTDKTDTPVILFAHGFASSKDTQSFKPTVENLTDNGIATFRIDLFGHGESEGKFEDITISKAVDCILSAIEYLKNRGFTKIGLVGSSFGGISSIMAASKTKDLFCLALKSPVSNYLEKELLTKPDKLQEWKEKGYKLYEKYNGQQFRVNYTFVEDFTNNDGYKVAPLIKIPTLIIHGDADETVPYEQSVKLQSLFLTARFTQCMAPIIATQTQSILMRWSELYLSS